MTTFHHQLRPILRRAAIAAVVVGASLQAFTAAPATAAGARSISPALAQTATNALALVGGLGDFDERGGAQAQPTYTRYAQFRDLAAELAAAELGLPASDLRAAWARSDFDKQVALLAALSQLGVAYRSNRSEPGVGFDCSGLTSYAWGVAGHPLARQSRAQVNAATRVDRAAAEAGDLMFYPGHVMIYLGVGDALVHSPYRGSEVEITFLAERRTGRVIFADPTV